MKTAIAFAALAAASAFAGPAFASSEANAQVNLCAAALDAQGVAAAGDYDARFQKSKGSAVKTVTIKLIPIAGGASIVAECQIKRGEVIEAIVKA